MKALALATLALAAAPPAHAAQTKIERQLTVGCTVFKDGHRTDDEAQVVIKDGETKVVEREGVAFALNFKNHPVSTGTDGDDSCEYWQVLTLTATKGGEEIGYASASIRAGLAGFLELRPGKNAPHLDCVSLSYTGDWKCPE